MKDHVLNAWLRRVALAAVSLPLGTAGCVCPDNPFEMKATLCDALMKSAAYDFPDLGAPATCNTSSGQPHIEVPPGARLDCEVLCRGVVGNSYTDVRGCTIVPVEGRDLASAVVTCTFVSECVGGRRPLTLEEGVEQAGRAGEYFAELARLEDASVAAFHGLAGELALLGAPAPLLRDVRAAARDEVRHAGQVAALARRHGRAARRSRAAAWTPRPRLAVAIDNAVEGRARECYGALVAHFQALRAADPAVRRALAEIARDEAGHAALSMRAARWLARGLGPAERAAVAAAERRALHELSAEAARPRPADLRESAGLPSPEEARALVAAVAALVAGRAPAAAA